MHTLFTPKVPDGGVVINGAMIPLRPLAYVPAANEVGVRMGNLFYPIEVVEVPKRTDAPLFSMASEPPPDAFLLQPVDARVATPCIIPYDRRLASYRTTILDTTPDAIATPEEKAVPGYVPNPGLRLVSKTQEYFPDDSIEFRYIYIPDGSSGASDPHPALRVGQTRYSVTTTDATGTVWDGLPFLPQENPINGNLYVRAYRYGLLLSDVGGYPVKVKIGKATAGWDSASKTLALLCPTASSEIRYSINGGSEATYVAALLLTDSATVTWRVRHTVGRMVESDTFTTTVTYDGVEPPANFGETYFSTLDEIKYQKMFRFMREADWYVSPSGSGSGKTADDPASFETIFGLKAGGAYPATVGLALGARSLYQSWTSNQLVLSYSVGSSTILYSLDGSEPATTYSGPLTFTQPTIISIKAKNASGIDTTPVFTRTVFVGATKLTYTWDDTAKTLTLALTQTDDAPLIDRQLSLAVDGTLYTGPITVESISTFTVTATHSITDEPLDFDFATASDSIVLPEIDPDVTASFTDSDTMTFAKVGGNATLEAYTHGPDIIWCAEGTYQNPQTDESQYFYSTQAVIVRGGFKSDYTERDVINRKSIISCAAWDGNTKINTYNIESPSNVATFDGLWGETDFKISGTTYTPGYLFGSGKCVNCHVDFDHTFPAAASNTTTSCSYYAFQTAGICFGCSCDITLTAPDGDTGNTGPTITDTSANCPGEKGGGASLAIWAFNNPKYCNIDAHVVIGNGGDGGTGGVATATYLSGTASATGGAGGQLNGTVVIGTLGVGCVCNATLTMGNGGNGGAGGTAVRMNGGPPFGNGGASASGGAGGEVEGSLVVNTATISCTETLSLLVGNGGNGGAYGSASYVGTPYYHGAGLGTPYDPGAGLGGGAGANTTASLYHAGSFNTLSSFTCVCGDGGDGASGYLPGYPPYTQPQDASGRGGDSISSATITARSLATIVATVKSGDAGSKGTSPYTSLTVDGKTSANISGGIYGVLPEVTYSVSRGSGDTNTGAACYTSANPVFFSSIYINEGEAYGGGNPVRVDHAAGSTQGWYSGLDDGDGAPFAGYETPAGSGIALGDYWE